MPVHSHLQAVELFQTWRTQLGADNFTSLLFNLYAKADIENRYALEQAFPFETKVYRRWYQISPEPSYTDLTVWAESMDEGL